MAGHLEEAIFTDVEKGVAGDVAKDASKDTAADAAAKTNAEIDNALLKVNPNFDRTKPPYSENCTGVVQAYELRRRGFDVEAAPLEKQLWSTAGGSGRPSSAITGTLRS